MLVARRAADVGAEDHPVVGRDLARHAGFAVDRHRHVQRVHAAFDHQIEVAIGGGGDAELQLGDAGGGPGAPLLEVVPAGAGAEGQGAAIVVLARGDDPEVVDRAVVDHRRVLLGDAADGGAGGLQDVVGDVGPAADVGALAADPRALGQEGVVGDEAQDGVAPAALVVRVDQDVAARGGLGDRGVVRGDGELAVGDRLGDRQAPALVEARVDGEEGAAIEVGELLVGQVVQLDDQVLQRRVAREHGACQVEHPAFLADQHQLRHALARQHAGEIGPDLEQQGVVLARLERADAHHVALDVEVKALDDAGAQHRLGLREGGVEAGDRDRRAVAGELAGATFDVVAAAA